jgi:DNA-binding MarR family transcriptional regulator
MWCTEEGTPRSMKSAEQNPSGVTKVFLLSPEGAISAFASEQSARATMADGDLLFDSPAELKRVTAEWPSSRLVGLWNSIPGLVPIKKFTNRSTGLNRIWAAIQTLEPVPEKNEASQSDDSARKARSGTKKAALLALLARNEGASVREIMAALGWQSHSVRGCISSLSRKGAAIHSFRRSDGERAYTTSRSPESDQEVAQ